MNRTRKLAKSLRTVIRRRKQTNVSQWSRAGGGDLPQVQGSEEASEEESVAEPGRRRRGHVGGELGSVKELKQEPRSQRAGIQGVTPYP